jgi:hypothetical protein
VKRTPILVALLGALAALVGCDGNNLCIFGCEGGQRTTGPSSLPSPTISPSPSPSPNSTPGPLPTPALAICVPQTQPFVCLHGEPTLGPILQAAQSVVAWAPEAIYVSNLVAVLNKDPRVCATSGFPLPSDEISIKYRASNSSSENWDVVNVSGEVQAIPAGPSTPAGPANICSPSRFD